MQNIYPPEIQIFECSIESNENGITNEDLMKVIVPRDESTSSSNLASIKHLDDVFNIVYTTH